MSWLFSRALVAGSSAGTCSAGEPSALSSGTPTPQAFWSPGRTTDTFPCFPSGMTCRPLTAALGADVLTSYLEASPVRTSAPPERVQESTASEAECGRTWLGSLARYDRDSCSWRTPQCSLLAGLDVYSETWPRSGTMRDGACSELATLPLHIGENDCFSWPTPLAAQAKRGWGTPLVKNPLASSRYGARILANTSRDISENGWKLEPRAQEWLMGWPSDWSDLKPLEMDRFQQWRHSHGER